MKTIHKTKRPDVPGTVRQQEKTGAVFEEDLVAFVEKEAERRREERLPYELQWKLNREFLTGNQTCDINAHRMTVENYEPLYDHVSREVFNRIAPIMETRRAHIMSVSSDLSAEPLFEDFSWMLKSDKVTALLKNLQSSDEYAAAYERAVRQSELTGNAFFLTWWDSEKGEAGAPAFTLLSPYEVLPQDLNEETVEKQRSLILMQVKDVDEIEQLYGVTVDEGEETCRRFTLTAGAGGLGYESSTGREVEGRKKHAALLLTYMENPGPAHPAGRLIITAGGKLLFSGVMPYKGYPVAHVKSEAQCGRFFGRSVIETLIPYQRCYNGVKNRILDAINRSSFGQLLVEEGSVDADAITDKGLVPGEPIVYERGSALPRLLEEPALSPRAEEQCIKLAEDMEYAAGVSGLMTDSKLPGGVVSGRAITLLQNVDHARLAAYADNVRRAVMALGYIWLSLYRRYLPAGKPYEIPGGRTLVFEPEELSNCRLRFVCENELRVNADEKRERCIEALKLGLFNDEEGKLSKKARLHALRAVLDPAQFRESEEFCQLSNAHAENEAFERGEAPAVGAYDDHALHVEEHTMYVLGKRFRAMVKSDPALGAVMTSHIEEHKKALEAQEKLEKKEERSIDGNGREEF